MPQSKSARIPKHCHHKARDLGVVRLDGRDCYTGRWGSPEADAEYRRLVAEWLVRKGQPGREPGGRGGRSATSGLSVGELILRFWAHVETYYRRTDGSPTSEPVNYRYSLRPLRALYEQLPAAEFSPLKLKAVRETMIAAGLARGVINSRVSRICRMFKWAVAEELVTEPVYRALLAVRGLRAGRSAARESEPIRCVPDDQVAAALPFLSPALRTMVEVQRLTGMRSDEVCRLRGADLDTTGDVWVYRPDTHKTAHHGKARTVFLGPKAQQALGPWLRANPDAFLFSPRDTMAERSRQRRAARQTAVQPSQRNRRKRKPRRQPGERYTTQSYWYAIRRACKRAGIDTWHPHQLRHSHGTAVRGRFGLEAAQVALGHANARVTEVYAERDQDLGRRVAAEVG